jgi:hypothetical protein
MTPRLLFAFVALSFVACTTADERPGRLPADLPTLQLPATIAVPADYGTIADALAVAVAGDVVAVEPGLYFEDLTLPGGVILQGSGLDQTTIEGHVTVVGGEAAITFLRLQGPGASLGTCGINASAGNSILLVSARVNAYYQGVCLDPGPSISVPWPTIDRVSFESNGYAVAVFSGQATITNSYFAWSPRSGIYGLDDTSITAINNTLLGNSFGGNETDRDAAISLGAGGTSVVRNNNVTSNLFGLQCAGCIADFDHNNVWGNTTDYAGDSSSSPTDLHVDPLLVSVSSGNLRLQDASPLIDQGSSDGAPDHDWDGLPRPSGAGFDIGADEWSLSAFTLVINEVMSNPSNETSGEFVEIANVGSEAVDVAGLMLSDGDSDDTIIAYANGTTVVPPGGYAVVLDPDFNGDYVLGGGAVPVTVGNARIGNGISTNDPIQLLEDNGYVVIDEWTIPFDAGDGNSVERVDVLSGNIASNWVVSSCLDGSSPGALNCAAGEIAPNDPSVLRITEVLANALNEQTGEFVELWNSGSEDVNLTGLIVTDGDSTDALIAFGGGDTILPGGAYALIVDPNYGGQYLLPSGVLLMTTPDATIGNGIANGSDPITLFDLDGATEIDSQTFLRITPDGVSQERLDYDAADSLANWPESTCAAGHSAGRRSCVAGGLGAGLVLNEVLNNPTDEQSGEFVELSNLGSGAIDLAGLWITDGDQTDELIAFDGGPTVLAGGELALIIDSGFDGDFTLPAGVVIVTTADSHLGNGLSVTDPVTLLEDDGASVVDTWGVPFNPGNGNSAEKVSGFGGDTTDNWTTSTCASGSSPGVPNCVSYSPIPAGSSTLTITEVMSNPLSEATGEYVEVFNHGIDPIDLWGLILYDGDAWDFLRSFQSGSTIVDPGEYAVIVDNGYAAQYSIPSGVTVVTVDDATIGSGLATNDAVQLYEADGYSVIDSFSFPFNPGNGVAVERVDIATGDIDANWVASPCDASPGAANCSAASITACNDGVDNDGDGWFDLTDPGCFDASDDDESVVGNFECSDEVDNDGDGLIDGYDPDCADPSDNSESAGCTDGVDNDSDGWTDLDDPDCATGDSEVGFGSTACNDDVDNDSDSMTDSADPECSDGFDDSEAAGCSDGLDNDGDGWTDAADPDCAAVGDETGYGTTECNDGLDNNGDGNVDGDDPECNNASQDEPLPYFWITVSEIMNNPSAVSDANGEWFEIYNPLLADIDIEGWNFYDGGGDGFDIVGSLIIPAQGYLVLGRNGDMGTNGGVALDYVYSGFDLDNVDDEIYIDDPTATEVFLLEYWELNNWPDSDGQSIGLTGTLEPSQASSWSGSNWCASSTVWSGSDGDTGTPGLPNEVCN